MHNLKFANNRLRKEERSILGTALSTLQRIGEVRAIYRGCHAVRTLTIDHDSRGTRGRLNSGSQLAELAEVPVAIRQVRHGESRQECC